ncbi:hypothetical protein Phum_PHUM235990 [Pediculus humanus corporis]|uniref:Uncharacterized protein n=1 Tax=Pediculus humanus subsp. corporis TaxID=121224 RepID=E0VIZ5_PEDHC|nr:uncharacterized protein Phum_PHUM235990 [Pediculus humanus corporis]EEB13351.1 hypothetical protein Phum_PHUM235990 [Pediculus humanus corporis]
MSKKTSNPIEAEEPPVQSEPVDLSLKDQNDVLLKNYWKTDHHSNSHVDLLRVSSQEQKSPTTKNPVFKSPWQSTIQSSTKIQSSTSRITKFRSNRNGYE